MMLPVDVAGGNWFLSNFCQPFNMIRCAHGRAGGIGATLHGGAGGAGYNSRFSAFGSDGPGGGGGAGLDEWNGARRSAAICA